MNSRKGEELKSDAWNPFLEKQTAESQRRRENFGT